MANSSMLVLPIIGAPALASFSTAVAVYGGVYPSRIREPLVLGTSSTQKRSFTARGTPPSGASGFGGAGASSATQRNAPRSSVAARPRYSSNSSPAETSPARTRSAAWAAVRSSSSLTRPGWGRGSRPRPRRAPRRASGRAASSGAARPRAARSRAGSRARWARRSRDRAPRSSRCGRGCRTARSTSSPPRRRSGGGARAGRRAGPVRGRSLPAIVGPARRALLLRGDLAGRLRLRLVVDARPGCAVALEVHRDSLRQGQDGHAEQGQRRRGLDHRAGVPARRLEDAIGEHENRRGGRHRRDGARGDARVEAAPRSAHEGAHQGGRDRHEQRDQDQPVDGRVLLPRVLLELVGRGVVGALEIRSLAVRGRARDRQTGVSAVLGALLGRVPVHRHHEQEGQRREERDPVGELEPAEAHVLPSRSGRGGGRGVTSIVGAPSRGVCSSPMATKQPVKPPAVAARASQMPASRVVSPAPNSGTETSLMITRTIARSPSSAVIEENATGTAALRWVAAAAQVATANSATSSRIASFTASASHPLSVADEPSTPYQGRNSETTSAAPDRPAIHSPARSLLRSTGPGYRRGAGFTPVPPPACGRPRACSGSASRWSSGRPRRGPA